MSNPCHRVRTTCRQWMEQEAPSWPVPKGAINSNANCRRSVAIHKDRIPQLAKDILSKRKHNSGNEWVEWDEENWHYSGERYNGSEIQKRERMALYILALDAINFCFWPGQPTCNTKSLEYEHLAIALKRLAETDDDSGNSGPSQDEPKGDQSVVKSAETYFFSPTNLASITPEAMEAVLMPHLDGRYLDNIEKRSKLWNELGTSLINDFQGSATNLITAADKSAPKLVNLIMQHFPGFRDVCTIDGQEIFFLKRAQIFVGDVNAALKLGLLEVSQLTCFADYRVPQLLRELNILEYSPELASIVDEKVEITAGSYDEISIRAATVVAVQDLVEHLNKDATDGDRFTAVAVDWYLWQVGEKMQQDGALKPFHRVRTHYY